MYTATMRYQFKPEFFEDGIKAWKRIVFEEAKKAEGLVRMQLLRGSGEMLAVGTWKAKPYAEAFMKTGVFKKLTEEIADKKMAEPVSDIWSLECFWEEEK